MNPVPKCCKGLGCYYDPAHLPHGKAGEFGLCQDCKEMD